MKGEIDKNFYCTVDNFRGDRPSCVNLMSSIYVTAGKTFFGETCAGCKLRKHKYPTPEQYREEYGEDYPDCWAVYYIPKDWPVGEDGYEWACDNFSYAQQSIVKSGAANHIVCAITPWGKPPDNWRPE